MALEFYFTENRLKGGKGFIPRPLARRSVGKGELVGLMARANTTMTGTDLLGALSLLEETILKLLSEGRSVSIGDILKLSPSLKGAYEQTDLRRLKHPPKPGITCIIDPDFMRQFQRNIRIKKISQPNNKPYVLEQFAAGVLRLTLHPTYPNSFVGRQLKPKRAHLVNVNMGTGKGKGEYTRIDAGDLIIHRHTRSMIMFSFPREFAFPGWLSGPEKVLVSFSYKNTITGKVYESNSIPLAWGG